MPGKSKPGALCEVTCAWCGNVFLYRLKSGSGRRKSQCNDCAREKGRQASDAWAKRNPERRRASYRRYHAKAWVNDPDAVRAQWDRRRFKRYGVTREWYEAELVRQGGCCANRACGRTEPGGRHNEWHIDHDHLTMVVRGLLCNNCNLAAGMASDNPDILRGLAQHIDAHRQLHLAV